MIDNVLNNMPPKKEPYYDEAEFAIVKGNTVFGNLMDDVRFYGELALVREGIEKIHEALPDYKMDEEGNRSGYGYDFLRLTACYWDVDYEYVGYNQSWDDMQQMLEDGEIDMVTSARKTPDREEKFDFSRPIGTNYGMLTVRSDNSTIVDGNYSTYNGMRVALLNGNIWRNLWILKR